MRASSIGIGRAGWAVVSWVVGMWGYGGLQSIFPSMYEKDTSAFLEVLEYTNLAIIILFLLLFTYRLHSLRSYSLTDKFKNYFPKLRIFFCLAYVLLSTSLIAYNIATDSYSETVWYEYVLQGGGGECIDSVILVIQLGVLRLELKKEQPYTRFHLWYFVYLMVMSLARFTLTLLDTLAGLNDLANLLISILLVADSAGQFAYWIKNRQSLPEFISHTHEEIDESRYQSQFLQKRAQIAKRSLHGFANDHFPYINAFVAYSNGKLRISLERTIFRLPSNAELLYDESGLNESFLDRQTNLTQQFVASSEFTIDQMKKFYTICGRFQLKKQLNFSQDMRSFIKQLQNFINDLFLEKKSYTPNILRFLKVPANVVSSYQQLLEKLYLLEGRKTVDATTGLQILPDRSGLYFSLGLYRFMWVCDHYEYYMRIATRGEGQLSYPIKRIQEVQELYQIMRKMIKTEGKTIELPSLPKLHPLPVRDDDLQRENCKEIQLFLKKLVNDDAIMEDYQFRQKILQFLGYQKDRKVLPKFTPDFFHNLKISKGRISKALIKNQYVTLYQFILRRNDVQVGTLMKRFRQIDALHQDIQRWMRSRKVPLGFSLPEKVLYKTEIRHEKLKNYLQNVLQLKEIWRCYAAAAFFGAGQAQEDSSSFISVKTEQKPEKLRYTLNNSSLMADLESFNGEIDNSPPPISRTSKMFSKIIDDLGNQDYD